MSMALSLDVDPFYAAQGAVVGAMTFLSDRDGDLSRRVKVMAGALVKGGARKRSEQIATVASGVVEGAIRRSAQINLDVAQVAEAAAAGALGAAAELGPEARDRVRQALSRITVAPSTTLQ
jgi:hypothetical protein